MNILTNPPAAIAMAKKGKSMTKAVGWLAVNGVFFAIAVAIFLFQGGMQTAATMAGAAFILTILAGLFFGWLLKQIVVTLGGKGKLYEGVSAIALALGAPSIGILVSAILLKIPVTGIANLILTGVALLVLLVTLTTGFATLYRSVKDLFATDMITTLVSVSVFMTSIILTFFLISFLGTYLLFGSLGGLGGLPLGAGLY